MLKMFTLLFLIECIVYAFVKIQRSCYFVLYIFCMLIVYYVMFHFNIQYNYTVKVRNKYLMSYRTTKKL